LVGRGCWGSPGAGGDAADDDGGDGDETEREREKRGRLLLSVGSLASSDNEGRFADDDTDDGRNDDEADEEMSGGDEEIAVESIARLTTVVCPVVAWSVGRWSSTSVGGGMWWWWEQRSWWFFWGGQTRLSGR
jgi:hypothetical protein